LPLTSLSWSESGGWLYFYYRGVRAVRKRKSLFFRFSLFCLALLLLPGISSCGRRKEEPPEKEVVRPVKMLTVAAAGSGRELIFPGRVRASRRVELSFKVSGPLVELPAEEGQAVKKGRLLARIDPRDFETRIAGIESRIGEAKAQLAAMETGARPEDLAILEAEVEAAEAVRLNAEQQYQRYRDLYVKRQVSKADFDRYKSEYDMARAQLATSVQNLEKGRTGARKEDVEAQKARVRGFEADLKGARDALGDTYLKAPFGGLVARRYVDNFTEVRAKEPIVSFQDVSRVEVLVDVPEMTMATIRKGGKMAVTAEFAAAPGKRFDLSMKEFATDADARTQTYQIVLEMGQPKGIAILPGMTATVAGRAAAGEEVSVIVPASAVFANETGGSQVWIIDRESLTVSMRRVATGELTGRDEIEIASGIEPGETVAVTGVTQLREGDRVRDLGEMEGYGK
jgi:RND family efflux transporter MFP subunit